MKNQKLIILKLNTRWLAVGVFLVILGFTVMGWDIPGVTDYETRVFAWHKLTLAPVILLVGYTLIGYSIMKLPKNK